MKIKNLGIFQLKQFVILQLAAYLIFWMLKGHLKEGYNGVDATLTTTLIFFILMIFGFVLGSIVHSNENNKDFGWFLGQLTITFFIAVSIFGTVNYYLFKINPYNFKVPDGLNNFEQIADFHYHSFMTITTAGYDGIEAVGYLAKIHTVLEIMTGIILLVYFISGFYEFKEYRWLGGKENELDNKNEPRLE